MEVLKLAFDLDLVSVVGMDVVIMAVRTIISIITDLLTIVRIDPITINHRHITNNRTITITTISRSIEAACILGSRILRDVAQSDRVFGLGPKSRRFKSCHPDFT